MPVHSSARSKPGNWTPPSCAGREIFSAASRMLAARSYAPGWKHNARPCAGGFTPPSPGCARTPGGEALGTRASSWAERWVAALPLDETGHVCLLRLLDLGGRAEEALSRYTAFTSELRTLDLAPSPALEQMGLVLERSSASAPPPRARSAALFTPMLIGRGPALAELLAAWRMAREGGGSVVLVEGELGIGKTRLCEEFLRRLERESNARMSFRAHGREGPGPVELGVLAQLTSGLATAPGLAGARPVALAALGRIGPAVRARFPSLPEDSGVDAGQALGEAVAAAAEESPVVLFIDDLPQADPASLRALLSLIETPPPGLLVLATARTGEGEPQVILSPACSPPPQAATALAS